jgi:hypothetical protein
MKIGAREASSTIEWSIAGLASTTGALHALRIVEFT